ncbi:phage T7 F exclusion suppressor FxsA [Metalysinibacillus saudimassiliensis]|uniref:Phage T7 F exclusion suppressor FxsA n=1 Tax=Metalysinibacillus saudimassiliensis TaxID=1461583 RepID=A0A078MEC7_9BACL|nr:phage T7 F exclusion suppressor FxsA [Metalysinibacillus saudimassiliensis]
MRNLFLAIVAYGVVEISLYLAIGKAIGILPTLLIILITSIIGGVAIRTTGIRTIANVQADLAQGIMPGVALIEGLMSLIGGVLLVLPGVVTDVLGLILLIPLTRKIFRPLIMSWLRRKTKNRQMIIIQK